MIDWQPIETARKDGTRMLLWDPKREVAVSGIWHHEPPTDDPSGYDPGWEGWSADNDVVVWDDAYDQPTHWAPFESPQAVDF